MRAILFLVPFLLLACGKPLPELEGIDRTRWVNDGDGCTGARAEMADALVREKEKLLSLNQNDVVELLGNPDQHELYSRNQKFFYYFVDPAPSCPSSADSTARRLVIRFNAVGLAQEVSVE